MSQNDFSIGNGSGATVRADLNSALQALATISSGAAAPSTTYAHQWWADTTTGTLKRRNAANGGWIVVRTLDEAFALSRSSNTILDISDTGKFIRATSTFTQTLDAAATLGDGWNVLYQNSGTGVITIDPNASETIDGATTLVLNPGEGCLINCNGTSFTTVGRGLVTGSFNVVDNLAISCSVGGSALTIALKTRNGNDPTLANPIRIPIRSATPANGDWSELLVTAAASLVVSSGSTLGTVNSTAFRFWIVGFNDAGTFRLGVINCLSGTAPNFNIYPLSAWAIASSTAEGGAGAADSTATFYTGTGVTSKAYVVLGYLTYESGLATAGTYASAPTRVQVFRQGDALPGDRFNVVREQTGAVATGTTTIPLDDTIPQSGEGDEYFDVTHAASSAANLVEVEAALSLSHSGTGSFLSISIIQDSVADAIAASYTAKDGATTAGGYAGIKHQLRAPAASTVYNLRAGSNLAGTLTINGSNATRHFGGVGSSWMSATEIMA